MYGQFYEAYIYPVSPLCRLNRNKQELQTSTPPNLRHAISHKFPTHRENVASHTVEPKFQQTSRTPL